MPQSLLNNIVQGDAYSVLKDIQSESVDLGVTSPPYNKQEKNNGGLVSKVIYEGFKDALPENEYQDNQIKTLDEIFRATKKGGSFFYNHKVRWVKGQMIHPMDWLRKTKWVIRQEIIWDRTIAANIRGWRFWQVEERIYWLYKPNGSDIGKELESKDAKLTSIWRAIPENKNSHPAPFPLWLPVRIILSVLKTHGTVLDPYAGSGTTCVAAHLLGLNYIGIEISKEYVDSAKRRLANSKNELAELTKEKNLHTVQKTYKQRKLDRKTPTYNKELVLT